MYIEREREKARKDNSSSVAFPSPPVLRALPASSAILYVRAPAQAGYDLDEPLATHVNVSLFGISRSCQSLYVAERARGVYFLVRIS